MALSGSLVWGPISNGAYFSFEWTATQNTTARTSTVSWKMYGRGRSSSPTYIASNYHLSINGSEVSALTGSWDGSSKFSFNNAKKDSGSFTVYHDSNGAGSFSAEIYAYISTSSYNWDTVSKTFNLDNIGSLGPYYSWVNLGQNDGTGSASTTFNLAANQVGYYWYYPPGDGKITIYSTGSTDTYGGFGTGMSLSSTQTSGGSIVTGESYSDDDSGDNTNFQCTDISVTGGAWAGQVFVHGYNNAVSGTLYIDFTPSNYTITFNANGGSGAPSAISCAPGGSVTIPTTKPTRTNMIFLGWSGLSNATFSTTAYLPGSTYTPDANKTLYAVWGYKLTINPNGGDMISGSYYDSNNQSVRTISSDPYVVGFTKTSSYGRDLANFQASYWYRTVNDVKYYNIPLRDGYTFNGWTVTSGNGQVVYEAPNTTHLQLFYNDNKYCYVRSIGTDYGVYYYINNETTPSNSTITAQWTANTYTVTFDANGGGTPSSTTKTVTYDSTYGTLPTISRTNYTFNGWYTAASGGTKITSTSTVSTAENHTLYAQWTRTGFTVTFDKNGGNTPNPLSKVVTQGSTYGTLATCTRTGYTLKGWYTAASGGTKVTSSTTVNLTANQTLYAQWTPITYTIAYNANGGTGTTASSSHTYGVAKALTANGFTKFGYTFKGWATTLDRAKAGYVDRTDKESVSNLSAVNGAIVNLYAVWEIYTRTYIYTNKKDGTSQWVPVEKYTYNTITFSSTYLYDDYSGTEYAGPITYEVGQTWSQWCSSKYNTHGLYCSGNYVYGPGGTQLWSMAGNAVLSSDVINSTGYEFV